MPDDAKGEKEDGAFSWGSYRQRLRMALTLLDRVSARVYSVVG
jgi:hypothetical protein